MGQKKICKVITVVISKFNEKHWLIQLRTAVNSNRIKYKNKNSVAYLNQTLKIKINILTDRKIRHICMQRSNDTNNGQLHIRKKGS